jgi:hypothetical protein
MIKIATIIAVFICSLASAQTQYDQGMSKALGLWKEGKVTESTALFERIASAEKDNWLPNYYIALMNASAAFGDKENRIALIDKAQAALDIEMVKNSNNPELLVIQAMINTVWIVSDPMVNGQKYSPKTMALYGKALAIAPENPRVIASKAEFEIGAAAFWGKDTKPMCDEIKRAIPLFENERPVIPFSPKWGLERAQESLKSCK